jgi:hypothetical protein
MSADDDEDTVEVVLELLPGEREYIMSLWDHRPELRWIPFEDRFRPAMYWGLKDLAEMYQSDELRQAAEDLRCLILSEKKGAEWLLV